MLVLGGMLAAIEAALFLVCRARGRHSRHDFAGRWMERPSVAAHGTEIAVMLILTRDCPVRRRAADSACRSAGHHAGFRNLARWQSYLHVSRQSLSFFQSDFSGRVVTKVWSAGK